MKKYLSTTLILAMLLIIGGLFLGPKIARAVDITNIPIVGGLVKSGINSMLADLSEIILRATALLVTFSGSFLSVAVNLTTHLGSPDGLVAKVTAINAVWITIRDISSIFIIFALLYYSIRTILGVTSTSLNKLIMNIILAGLLINFSLFFVKIAVDASNLISLQFYNAIAPETDQNLTIDKAFTSGGLSNIFMQSLKIPTIYQGRDAFKGADVAAGIFLATVGGILVMVTASISFLAAAIAFVARTAILLFVMAVSPIIFVGMIFPEVKKKVSDKVVGQLYSQCVFMPVYLFLMYIALKIISDPGFMKIFTPTAAAASNAPAFGPVWLAVIIQYTIALLFINLPLVAAISLGGAGMKWAPNALDISKRLGGLVGRNTAGWAGKKAGGAFDRMAASASTTTLGRGASTVLRNLGVSKAVRGTLTAAETGKYGGKKSFADVAKEDKERTRTIAGVQRTRTQEAAINAVTARGARPTGTQMTAFREIVGKMSKKELEETEFEALSNDNFITKVSSKQFETLIDGESLTELQKEKLKDVRKKAIEKDLSLGVPDVTKELMKNLSGKELSKIDPALMKDRDVMDNLNPEHIHALEDTLDQPTKIVIQKYISGLPPINKNKSYGFFRDDKNVARWS